MTDVDIERAIVAGGLTAAVKLILERMDLFQRVLDTMAANQGNLILQSHNIVVAVQKLQPSEDDGR